MKRLILGVVLSLGLVSNLGNAIYVLPKHKPPSFAAIKKVQPEYNERRCLAENIYREARGEPYEGKLAVGQVTLNRVKSKLYPNSICKVVFQKHQFSWTKDFDKYKATKEFYALADKILSGEHLLSQFNATHFHAVYVRPNWKKLIKIATIGNHIFYTNHERFH